MARFRKIPLNDFNDDLLYSILAKKKMLFFLKFLFFSFKKEEEKKFILKKQDFFFWNAQPFSFSPLLLVSPENRYLSSFQIVITHLFLYFFIRFYMLFTCKMLRTSRRSQLRGLLKRIGRLF